MTTRSEMRVSDAERQAAADRLRAYHADGRLDLLEYDSRLAAAYAAVTYGDLDKLFTDLPATTPSAPAATPAAATIEPKQVLDTMVVADMHLALKVLWTIWTGAVLINLTVWLLVSLGSGEAGYFWPMWLAVPGVALVGATVGVESIRRNRRQERRRLP
ncbi:DUF1707 SHOCT-like domain-containing protein [Blastococcus sp. PRF04-17]|uniref:DUF1707 SHOCT-like domain-containing protein n=1 Tax=Blastococcus sp. PRF04-17 TaxID=2933797 RepID=UPI001FF19565|nr:DUF1707 domain-containing protein [Blastococcus sp. PRF04-17]UOY01923.1 DUF1707 domain-containing protein [Blastococcus sp. PRF04-17]